MNNNIQITVSVTSNLITDQRVHKVCTTLMEAGYQVTLIGRRNKNGNPLQRKYKTRRMRLLFNRSFLFYAEYNLRLLFLLLFSKTDIFLSNDTDTLPANFLASKIKRKTLVFDAHEMFPEVPELVNRALVKSVWTRIEDLIFPHLKYCYTVCQSIADIYNQKYGIDMQVVRNIPFAAHQPAQTTIIPTPLLNAGNNHILLYQGAVNIGRGIEWIIDAMPFLDDCVFYIAGGGDITKEIRDKISSMKLDDRVRLLGQIPFEDLPGYTKYAQVGMSLLENRGLNYYYSLPNRIFDFIRAGVPILASDFPEIRRIIEKYDIGILTDHHEPEHLAGLIRTLLKKEKNKSGFEDANKELTWENESRVIVRMIKDIIRNDSVLRH